MDITLSPEHHAALQCLCQDMFSKCTAGATGTFFLVSDENRSGQVVIHKGRLVGISYGGDANLEALRSLACQNGLRHSFTPELIFPVPETLLPEQADALLATLGFNEHAPTAVPRDFTGTGPAESDTAVANSADSAAKGEKPTKRLRIYRGQVVG